MNRLMAAVAVSMAAIALTACAAKLPPYAEVKAETDDAIQQIIAALPDGFTAVDESGTPYGCGGGRGLFYTAHWVADGPAEFDGQAFVDSLPGLLGEDFVVDDSVLETGFPVIRLIPVDQTDLLVDVVTSTESEEPWIDILAISRCGEAPAE